MDLTGFGQNSTGRLVSTPYNVHAFIPNPLPPNVDLSAVMEAVVNANGAISELRGASRRLNNPYILVRPLQRREALTSSAMEGTFTTADNLLIADAGIDERQDQAAIEVSNYLKALKGALEQLSSGLPICHKVIRTAHGVLLQGVGSHRGANRDAGEYKRDQNAIGGQRRGIEYARFVPPPPAEALQCMDDLERYINRNDRSPIDSLIDLALVHYQFETIHPFADGNGRVGRMLISLMAVERELFDLPLLYISPELEGRKDEYIDLMLEVSKNGKWENWINFFLNIVAESARNSIGVIDKLLTLQEQYRTEISQVSRTSNAVALVDLLFEQPLVSVRNVQDHFGVTYRAARNTIDKLIEHEILIEIPDRHPSVFLALEIMRVADRS